MYVSKELRLNLFMTKRGITQIKRMLKETKVNKNDALSYRAKSLLNVTRNRQNMYNVVSIHFDHDLMDLYLHYVVSDEEKDFNDQALQELFNYFSVMAQTQNDHFVGTLKQNFDEGEISEKYNLIVFQNDMLRLGAFNCQ